MKSRKPSALKLEENEWIIFSTVSHPFIFHMLHPIATTEFLEKLLQALCLQTILLKLVELYAFSRMRSLKEVKKCTNMRRIAPGNINGIKSVFYVFFPMGWRVLEPILWGRVSPDSPL